MSIAIKASYEICLKIQMAQIEPVDSNVDFGRENSKSNTNTTYSYFESFKNKTRMRHFW